MNLHNPLPGRFCLREGGRSRSTLEPAGVCQRCAVRGLTFCGALEPEELRDLETLRVDLRFEAGQMLFYEGDPAEHVFNLTEGAAKLYKLLPDGRRQIVGFVFAGDFAGLAPAETYGYSAEAITRTKLCRFRRARLAELANTHPKIERRLFEKVLDDLGHAQEQMLLLGRKTARERVASFLLRLSARAVIRGAAADPVELPMTRGDIADYLGLTTETVSRTLTQLQRDGLIALGDSHQASMLRRPELEALCGAG